VIDQYDLRAKCAVDRQYRLCSKVDGISNLNPQRSRMPGAAPRFDNSRQLDVIDTGYRKKGWSRRVGQDQDPTLRLAGENLARDIGGSAKVAEPEPILTVHQDAALPSHSPSCSTTYHTFTVIS